MCVGVLTDETESLGEHTNTTNTPHNTCVFTCLRGMSTDSGSLPWPGVAQEMACLSAPVWWGDRIGSDRIGSVRGG